MPHAAPSAITALGLVSLLALSACDRSANAPASPRTSEIVHLSQAPIDAVPLRAEARPVARPVEETPTEEAVEDAQATDPAQPVETSAPTVTLAPAPAAAPTAPAAATPQTPTAPADVKPNT